MGAHFDGKQDPLEIYVVRHGETMLNVGRRMQGWVDAPLTPPGEEVVRDLGRGLAAEGITFDAAYSSDLGRAKQTAALVLKEAGQPELAEELVPDWRLREVSFGSYEGLGGHEVFELVAEHKGISIDDYYRGIDADQKGFIVEFTNALASWDEKSGAAQQTWPAERYEEIEERAKGALDEIGAQERQSGSRRVLVVAHGMTIAILLAALGADERLPDGGFANASVSLVTYNDGHYEVRSVNDTRFLEKDARVGARLARRTSSGAGIQEVR